MLGGGVKKDRDSLFVKIDSAKTTYVGVKIHLISVDSHKKEMVDGFKRNEHFYYTAAHRTFDHDFENLKVLAKIVEKTNATKQKIHDSFQTGLTHKSFPTSRSTNGTPAYLLPYRLMKFFNRYLIFFQDYPYTYP